MKNQMEKKMENEMEAILGLYTVLVKLLLTLLCGASIALKKGA